MPRCKGAGLHIPAIHYIRSNVCARDVNSWHMASNKTALGHTNWSMAMSFVAPLLFCSPEAQQDGINLWTVTSFSDLFTSRDHLWLGGSWSWSGSWSCRTCFIVAFSHTLYLFIYMLCPAWLCRFFAAPHPHVSRIHFLFINICFLYQYAKTFINDQYVQISFSQPFI